MSQRPVSRARGHLPRGALLSLLLHVHLLVPIGLVAWIYGGRQEAVREAQKAQEVDVEFKDVTADELPPDLPPIDPLPDQLEPPKPPPRAEARKKPEPKKVAAQKQPTDEAEGHQEARARGGRRRRRRRTPKPEQRAHEKMVDLDNEKEVEPPPDAKYLAQKNNRADVETRATDTNLQKAQQGEGAASEKSDRAGHRDRRGQAEDRRARGQEVRARAQGARRHAPRQPGGRAAGARTKRRSRCWRCAIPPRSRTS